MGEGRKTERKAAGKGWIWLVSVLLLAELACTFPKAAGQTTETAEPVTEGWYYVQDGERIPVSLPADVPAEEEGGATLYHDSLAKEAAGRVLSTRGAQHGLTITLDGQVLYAYEDTAFPRNAQMKSKLDCTAQLPEQAGEGVLALTLTSRPVLRKNYHFEPVWVGSGSAVTVFHFKNALPTFAVAFLFAILGILAIGTAVYLRYRAIDARRFVDTALFLLICSVWFVTDSSVMQQYGGRAALICIVSFYAFMLLAVPMLHFVKNIGNMHKYRILDILILAFYANAAGQGLLNLCFGIDFIEMLFVTHVLLAGGVAIAVTLMLRESLHSKNRDVRMVLAAFVTLATSGVLALALYWLLEIPYYGSIFQAGILIFVILILADIIISMAENIHYRMESLVYQRMAKEDWMTGLGNRQPFDEQVSGLQEEQHHNVGLIFLDVNQLKKINDEYGHAAGDEVIIGAARCITTVFGGSGTCYRIGGDEFCVILPDSDQTPEEWFALLEREIQQYNRSGRYRLSLSWGWSNLYGPDGKKKKISDWKYEADCRMYEDKNRKRQL